MTNTNSTDIVRLDRTEADIVVRHLTGEYHNRHGVDNSGRLEYFAAKLSWQIGGDNTRDFRDYLVDALRAFENLMDIYWGDQPHGRRDRYESDLNVAVNGALNAAGFAGDWINRRGEQLPVSLPVAA